MVYNTSPQDEVGKGAERAMHGISCSIRCGDGLEVCCPPVLLSRVCTQGDGEFHQPMDDKTTIRPPAQCLPRQGTPNLICHTTGLAAPTNEHICTSGWVKENIQVPASFQGGLQ